MIAVLGNAPSLYTFTDSPVPRLAGRKLDVLEVLQPIYDEINERSATARLTSQRVSSGSRSYATVPVVPELSRVPSVRFQKFLQGVVSIGEMLD
jgi:hypothetical protein